ncbi:MAG TPA: class II aldolase/adducin family protein, partial [Streptosporangiaceae bacterium]
MTRDEAGLRAEVAEAAHVLARLGLVTAFGHVSARVGGAMLITPAADLAGVSAEGLIEVALSGVAPAEGSGPGVAPPGVALPAGAPAEAWAHLAVYRQRPDADAVARAQPPSAFAAAAVATATGAIRPLHGQAAWLGERIP